MKPNVNRVASIPQTALVYCHGCYRLISFDPNDHLVRCPACGMTVKEKDLHPELRSSVHPG